MEYINFAEYCKSKRINPDLFKRAEPELYSKFKSEFTQMSPQSFTAQKLFLINDIRRRFNFAPPLDAKTIKQNSEKTPIIKPSPVQKNNTAKPHLAVKIKPKAKSPAQPAIKITPETFEERNKQKVSGIKPVIPKIKKGNSIKPVIKPSQKKAIDDQAIEQKKVVSPVKPKIPPSKSN